MIVTHCISLVDSSFLHNESFCTSTFFLGDFVPVHAQATSKQLPREQAISVTEEEGEQQSPFYLCPSQGCIKSFQRHYNLEKHMLYGKCQMEEERYTLMDKAKLMYAKLLEDGSTRKPQLTGQTSVSQADENSLSEGWALKSTKTGARFNDNQKRYLDDKFLIGQETGNKADPSQVSHDMRHAKDQEGKRRFTVGEFITSQQIQSYFSRKKNRQAAEEEAAFHFYQETVFEECQLVHPIIYDIYNVCQLVSNGKLNKLSIPILHIVCEFFHMDVEKVSIRRKLPYTTYLALHVPETSMMLEKDKGRVGEGLIPLTVG